MTDIQPAEKAAAAAAWHYWQLSLRCRRVQWSLCV